MHYLLVYELIDDYVQRRAEDGDQASMPVKAK
jgi:hypothetical protein